jgi:hypothetical protein
MAPKDETGTERKARKERIEKASAKAIKNMLAGTALGDKLRAKGYTWGSPTTARSILPPTGCWPAM